MNQLTMIPVGKLHPHPDNPRKDLGDLSELADSIRTNGIMQNLTVVPAEDTAEEYMVIIGHRRLAAAKLAGLEAVPCAVTMLTPQEQVSTMLLENMQRSDLTAYEQAQGFQMMMDLGETVATVAEKTGFSQTTVRKRLEMARLDQDLLKEVSQERQLSLGDFDKLAQLDSVEQRNECLKKIGTSEFEFAVKTKLRTQEIEKKLPAAKAEIKRLKLKKLQSYSERFSSKYDKVCEVQLDKWEEGAPLLPAGKSAEFYWIDTYWIYFYATAKRAEPVKRSDAEIERDRKLAAAWDRANELRAVTYRLRSDFTQGLAVNAKNADVMFRGLLGLSVFRAVFYWSTNNENVKSLLCVDNSLYGADLVSATNAALQQADNKTQAALIYALFGDGEDMSYISGYKREFPRHQEYAKLDALYDWLTSLGYEMSEEEIALRDGTHELFRAKED